MAGERNLQVAVDDRKPEEPQTDEIENGPSLPALSHSCPPNLWNNISLGDQYDVRDTEGYWCEAEVLKIDTRNKRIFVTFIYWDNTWDAWISESDNVIAPLHSYTYIEGGKLQLGQRIEALDKTNKWLHAFVIDISDEKEQIKVHYRGWHEKFDEWLDKKGSRIRPYGRNKPIVQRRRREQKLWRVPGQLHPITSDGGNRLGPKSEQNILSDNDSLKGGWGTDTDSTQQKIARSPNNSHDDAEHRRQISEVSDRYNQYIEALQAQPVPLKVVSVPGDGNCLFRSVAHQVYGDYELHNLVRQRCMDYMEADAGFYSQFVEGGMEAFPFYLRAKRLNACWGDDPEIQSICELYNRPAEIWAYDTQRGARKLRTFHEATGRLSTQLPLRLSYYGGGHYDSIIDAKHSDQLLQSAPGEAETLALTRVTERVALASSSSPLEEATRESDFQATEQAALDLAVQMSRSDNDRFDWQDDLETCLTMSLEEYSHKGRHTSGAMDIVNDTRKRDETGTDSTSQCVSSGLDAVALRSPSKESASLIAMQGDILRTVAAESEREFLERAMLSSITDETQSVEDQLLHQARLESIADADREDEMRQFSDSLTSNLVEPRTHSARNTYSRGGGSATLPSGAEIPSEFDLILKLSELSEEEALQMALKESASARPAPLRFVSSSSSDRGVAIASAPFEGKDENDALGTALRMYMRTVATEGLSSSSSSRVGQNQNQNGFQRHSGQEDEDDELQRAIAESLR